MFQLHCQVLLEIMLFEDVEVLELQIMNLSLMHMLTGKVLVIYEVTHLQQNISFKTVSECFQK